MEVSIIRKSSISESDFSHSEHDSYSHGFMTTVPDGTAFAWGSAKDGGLGTWKYDAHQPRKMDFDIKFSHIGAGVNFNVAINEKGQLYTWGDGEYGKLGHGDKFSRLIPTLLEDVQHVTFSAISVGHFHTAAITQEGHVYTWGLGAHGCLGHGDEFSQYKPRVICDLQHTRIISVSAGKAHTMAVTDKGQVYAWGCGARYALGTGRTDDCYKPRLLNFPSNVKVTQVSCGSYHSLALTEDGRIYSWGYGAYGRLGHNNTSNVATPVKVDGFNYVPFAAVSAGHSHSMALSEEGEIYTWGKNSYGQLGHGDYNLCLRPTKIKTSVTFICIVAAKYHSLALTEEGIIYTWGSGAFGKLGHGAEKSSLVPKPILGYEHVLFSQISSVYSHCAALSGTPGQATAALLRKDFLKLLSSKDSSNVQIVINKKTLFLHAPILLARCPKMLERKNANNIFNDLPVSDKSINALINYIYGEVLPEHSVDGVKDLIGLLALATLFHLDLLKQHCLRRLALVFQFKDAVAIVEEALKFELEAVRTANESYLEQIRGVLLHLHTTGSNETIINQIESRILGYKQFASIVKESVEISGEEMTLSQIWELGITANSSLSRDMDSLFTKQMECDFKLEVEDRFIWCHKLILSTRCTFFAALFRSGMAEASSGVLKIPGPNKKQGITYDAAKGLIRYFYSGKQSHLKNPYDCMYILVNSAYFGLATEHLPLVIHCGYAVRNSLTTENCLELLDMATELGEEKIKDKILNYIVSNYEEVVKKPFFKQIPYPLFIEINVAFNLRVLNKIGPI